MKNYYTRIKTSYIKVVATVVWNFTFKLSLCLVKIKFQVEQKKGSWLLGGVYYSCKSGNLQSSHQGPRFIIHNFAGFTRVVPEPRQLNCARQPKAHRGRNYPSGSRWINQSVPYSAVWLLSGLCCDLYDAAQTKNSKPSNREGMAVEIERKRGSWRVEMEGERRGWKRVKISTMNRLPASPFSE